MSGPPDQTASIHLQASMFSAEHPSRTLILTRTSPDQVQQDRHPCRIRPDFVGLQPVRTQQQEQALAQMNMMITPTNLIFDSVKFLLPLAILGAWVAWRFFLA